MRNSSTHRTAPEPLPMLAEDHWPDPIDVDFDDDVDEGPELEDWPLDEDVRRMLNER